MDRALPMTTGAEGVETAIKCARKWGYSVKGIPANKARIIVCAGNFHGRTSTIVGFSSEAQYRESFGPYADGFDAIPFGDTRALEAAIRPDTAAFLVEPIQGEAGIIVPPEGYLTEALRICRARNVLMIVDEVQTGLGRTGKVLACHHEGVKPDAIILGKALGGGLIPVSAFCGRANVLDVFRPGDHGSTFGGNALGAAVGLESLNVLLEEKLSERAAQSGAYLLKRLKSLSSPMIVDVRGKGLLIGLEIDTRRASARQFVETLLKHGVLSKDTRHRGALRAAAHRGPTDRLGRAANLRRAAGVRARVRKSGLGALRPGAGVFTSRRSTCHVGLGKLLPELHDLGDLVAGQVLLAVLDDLFPGTRPILSRSRRAPPRRSARPPRRRAHLGHSGSIAITSSTSLGNTLKPDTEIMSFLRSTIFT
jgi:ornithine--oxo-acid transaminase